MKFTVLKINEHLLYFSSTEVGVVSICNNKNGTEFCCYERNSIDEKRKLYLGNRLDINLISLNSIHAPSKFKLPGNFIENADYSDNNEAIPAGMEITIRDTTINAPFIKDGVQSVLITINKNECTINVGGMTPDNEMLDYHYSALKPGDSISISLKNLMQISEPICKRPFKGCSYENENL